MNTKNMFLTTPQSQNVHALTQILNKYADETVSDEQVMRVLEPVIAMIKSGMFDKKRSYDWLAYLMTMTTIIVTLLLVAVCS